MDPVPPDPTQASERPRLEAVARLGRVLAAAGPLDDLLARVVRHFGELAGAGWTCLYLHDPSFAGYRLRAGGPAVPGPASAPPSAFSDAAAASLFERGPEARTDADLVKGLGPCRALPLFTEGAPAGFLLFEKSGTEPLGEEAREFLETLAAQIALALRHAVLLDETARMAEELAVLNEISRLFTRGGEAPEAVLEAVWGKLRPVLDLDWGLLVALRQGQDDRRLGSEDVDDSDLQRIRRWCALLLDEKDRGRELRKGEVLLLDADEVERSYPSEFRPTPGPGGGSFGLVPAFCDEDLAAILLVRAAGGRSRLQAHRRLLQHVSPALSSALQKWGDQRKLERLATTDGLTGLYNHRYFHERLQQEYLRAYRLQGRVGLLLLDVDHFKRVNDAFGHLYGDRVLARIGEVLRVGVRDIDIVARYGGEEFAVILPDANGAETAAVGERVRLAVEQTVALGLDAGVRRLTVSAGAASYPESAGSEKELVEAADRALYQAKHAGRNRVCPG
jgi:diguanylate cyclase (GGDEF)-like protein